MTQEQKRRSENTKTMAVESRGGLGVDDRNFKMTIFSNKFVIVSLKILTIILVCQIYVHFLSLPGPLPHNLTTFVYTV